MKRAIRKTPHPPVSTIYFLLPFVGHHPPPPHQLITASSFSLYPTQGLGSSQYPKGTFTSQRVGLPSLKLCLAFVSYYHHSKWSADARRLTLQQFHGVTSDPQRRHLFPKPKVTYTFTPFIYFDNLLQLHGVRLRRRGWLAVLLCPTVN